MSIFKSKLEPPQLKVVADEPWRRPLIIGLTALVGLVCLVAGFAVGQNRQLVQRLQDATFGAPVDENQQRLERMESELIDARLSADVQRNAARVLRLDLTRMREQTQQLQEEVSFYKSLMAPGSLVKGVQITELELTNSEDAQHFAFELLLTQVAQRRTYISGVVRLDIIGQYSEGAPADGSPVQEDANDEVVLSLTEVSEVESYPFKFKFRYFQDLSGELTLPEGFLPHRVLVTAEQNGKEPLQETFPWPDW